MANAVQIRKDLPSATVRIDCPENRNALGPEVVTALLQALEDLHGEKKVRAVVLTGSDQAFSSGTDLKRLSQQMADVDSPSAPEILQGWHHEVEQLLELMTAILRFPKPVIAAVNGIAAGTGLALALACDFLIGGRTSCYSVPESRHGLMPGLSAPLLGFRVSNATARQMVLSSAIMDSGMALQAGLIDERVDDNLVWARAQQLATLLAESAPSSQQLAKRLCNETIGEALFVQLANGAANMAAARITESARRGVDAFLTRSRVNWDT
jgi:enoyl-CoA hydratase/carnithine racemase